ncbi:MAG: aspartate aminotransferase family protein [Alphaproteobacteria bacterium]|jgi:acetylornithine/N-succinyldiaminopimelate aminotransferase|nr:aspartate aminotransferase family protein [Alphaproteobacteria bacterium]MBT5828094.1 aspartate aminotransferase family protein [Alphaproteobacteria bacterium]
MLSPLLQVYKRCNIEFTAGKGVYLYSKDKKKYIDLGAGIAVNSLGYANKKLVKALKKAADKPWHVSNLYEIEGQVELASKLVENSACDQVFFCNSGAEAIETAVKIIRKHYHSKKQYQKKEVITFEHAFHGRTMTAISAAGSKKYQDGYAPLLPGFRYLSLKNLTIEKVAKEINSKTAALIIEPIQGEGGVHVFSNKFLKDLAKLCKEKKIIFGVDEVQCGMGRTGKIFHHQWANIKPDIITAAKGIGGGFPLGACLVRKDIASAMTMGSHGGTYGGSPLAMAVGNAVFAQIAEPKFLASVQENGALFKEGLCSLQQQYPQIITEVRGEGLILGIRISHSYMKLVDLFRANNLLTIPASNDVIRVIPPLIITKKEIKLALSYMEKSLKEFEQND